MYSFPIQQKIYHINTWVIILGGLMLTVIAFMVVRNWDRQRLQANFEHATDNRYAALKREIESDIEVLSSVRAFYLHTKVVTRSEFSHYTESFLRQHPGIQALVWIPRVPYSQREEYEKAARRDGFKDFHITEQSAQNKMAKAGKRSEYFPVYFVEPYENKFALGYDLASNPLRKEALDRSRDTGEMTATARITLVPEKEGLSGFLVFAPIYLKDMPAASIQARKDNIRGFVQSVFRIGDVVERSLTYLDPAGIDCYLYDNSAQGKEHFLYFHAARTRKTINSLRKEGPVPDSGLKITKALKVADREWQILYVATPDYVARGKTWQPWGVLLAGLLFTGLLAGFFIVSARRAEELIDRNEVLLQEIAGRKQAEEGREQGVHRLRETLGATIQALAATAEVRDPYTAGHQHRVAELARVIATEMHLTDDQIDGIRMASRIHDIGKISVPAEILSKPKKLTEIEFNLIKTHVQNGYEILKEIEFPWPIARMVLEHHERMDGSGYPHGLTGDKLLLESRIIAVSDVVEAMSSHRPYRPGMGINAALEEIEKNRGIYYDKTVADICLRLFREKGYKLEGHDFEQ